MSDMIQQGLAGQQVNVTLEAMKQAAADERAELRAEQQTSPAFMKEVEDAANPFAAKVAQRLKKTEPSKTRVQKMLASGEKSARLYHRKN